MKNLLLVITAAAVGLFTLAAPSSAEARLAVSMDLLGGEGFQVALRAPDLETRFDVEAEEADNVNPTKERVKGAIKISVGAGLLAAGSGLAALTIYVFVYAALYTGGTPPSTNSLGGVASGILVGLGIGVAIAAGVCLAIGVAMVVQGAAHIRRAEEHALLLAEPERRYSVQRRDKVTWGLRFADATPAR